ncbi:hypothetical protein FQZ97_935890 [compost metagenome]
MRGHAADGLVVVEVVAELGDVGVVLVLAGHQGGLEQAFVPEPFAQALHQHGVFGPAFGQDVAHAVEHEGNGGEIGARLAVVQRGGGLQEGLGFDGRSERGVGQQLVGQRLDAEFAGDLALGAALLLERQVQVFELLLGGREFDRGAQLGGQLALLVDGLEHRHAAVFEFAQVRQPGFQFAQLDVVEAARDFLAIAGNERNRGAFVEQFDGGLHLVLADLDFNGELANDFLHVLSASLAKRGSLP